MSDTVVVEPDEKDLDFEAVTIENGANVSGLRGKFRKLPTKC